MNNSLKQKIQIFQKENNSNIKIICDFDGTLTKKTENNSINVFRNENYLSKDYKIKSNNLYKKYHKFEIDETLNKIKKSKLMEIWWNLHWDLLIKEKVNKKDLKQVIKLNQLKLRNKLKEFFEILEKYNIQNFIFSAGTKNLIEMVLIKKEMNFKNTTKIISNEWDFDKEGNFIGIKNKIIHAKNKNEKVLKEKFNKSNVILIGDSISDILMCENYKNIIKIGFHSKSEKTKKEDFDKNFDLVISDTCGFYEINEILKEILN